MVVYIGLGKISGTEVIAQLQRNHPEVPVIITGYSLPNTVLRLHGYTFFPDSIQQTRQAALKKAFVFSKSRTFRKSLDDI